jgi:carbamoyl-phosphate synthase small subunit
LATLLANVQASPPVAELPLVARVTTAQPVELVGHSPGPNQDTFALDTLVAIDFGMKRNILNQLQRWVRRIVVLPASATLADVKHYAPQAVFLSNGPGDPNALPDAHALVKALLAERMPTFGICLGHQLLALALGLRVEKMAFGHHGGNHPVWDADLKRVLITSQNHGYCVMLDDAEAERLAITVTHRNLNDGSIEGFRHQTLPVAAVQFHPEAAPGPHDAHAWFEHIIKQLSVPQACSALVPC